MVTTQMPELVQQKLAAFERIQPEFERCFCFVQDVHGQKRFPTFPVDQIVHYLHALWLCECKDRLLSVYKNIRRYDGAHCLELLRAWQDGQTAGVEAFLLSKLDISSFAAFTAQIEEARSQRREEAFVEMLEHGRLILLTRGVHLVSALETLSTLSASALLAEVRAACVQYGHTPEQIEAQLAELETPLYAYRSHAALAQRNMTLMNRLEVEVVEQETEQSTPHFWRATSHGQPRAPFAEQTIDGYLEMLAPGFNNTRGVRFVDRSEATRD